MNLINRADKLLKLALLVEYLKEKHPNSFNGYAKDLTETSDKIGLTRYFNNQYDD